MRKDLYTSGEYLKLNPGWHVEESPWKAKQVMRMMMKNNLAPGTICEVGCGAGEILTQLQEHMDDSCLFWGYGVSPQAIELAKIRANERLQFKLGDIRQEKDAFFDLMLVMDVIEHLEDYLSFLREIKAKSHYKIFHNSTRSVGANNITSQWIAQSSPVLRAHSLLHQGNSSSDVTRYRLRSA